MNLHYNVYIALFSHGNIADPYNLGGFFTGKPNLSSAPLVIV